MIRLGNNIYNAYLQGLLVEIGKSLESSSSSSGSRSDPPSGNGSGQAQP